MRNKWFNSNNQETPYAKRERKRRRTAGKVAKASKKKNRP